MSPANGHLSLLATTKGNPGLLTLALHYIPPSAPRNAWDTLEMSLETLCTRTPSRLVIMGDFNDNLLDPSGPMTAVVRRLPVDNHVHLPTRFTATTSTLLDLLLSDKDLVACCQVISSDINDHYSVVATLKVSPVRSAQHPASSRRLWTVDWKQFNEDLHQACIDTFSSTSVDQMLDEWHDKVFLVLDSHCPLLKPKSKTARKGLVLGSLLILWTIYGRETAAIAN